MTVSPRRSPILSNGIANGQPNGGGLRGRKSGLKARGTQLLALRFGWVVLVIWFEVGDFFHSLSTCRFPDSVLRRSNPSLSTPPTHVVLLADTHVPHPRLSYAPDSRPWVNWLKQQMDELFMRKSWNVVMRLGRIDAVIVVGDMLDWGRGVMSDEEYEDYYRQFRSIFQLPSNVPMHFVPGNHDIPLGPNKMFSPHSRDRYAQHFSPPNAILPIANHSLIMLDAVGLVEEDYRRYAAEMQFGEWDGVEGGVIEFVKDLGDEPPPAPRILISHIPLARPEASTCGPLRERGRISKGAGPGYQNLLGSETSKFLLEALQPSIVFSGDDHDYCEHTHPNGIREVTIKSFSSSTGIRRPGFQLLSLVPPASSGYSASLTHADRPCFLPDQLGVYSRVYIPLAILTLLYLFGTNVRAAYQRWNAAGNSVYSDLKSRLSPALLSSETVPNSASLMSRRGVSERPVPLTLPSRKSSQQLAGMTSMSTGLATSVPRTMRYASEQLTPNRASSSVSAPVSPYGSPRASFSEERPTMGYTQSSLGRMDEDVESGPSYRDTYTSSPTPPNMSRRSSYIYMNDHRGESIGDPGLLSPSANGGAGLGLSTPQGSHFPFHGSSGPNQPLRRVSSSNLSAMNGMTLVSPNPVRRVTMPRTLTNSDWSSSTATKKEKSMFNYVVDNLPASGGRKGVWKKAKGFMRWLWKTRNGVVAKSWREILAVAWPAGVVWLLVNALFFLE
ncbi:hypothetical protein CI109_105569 [Kwoniella shandongensis]|uniref:Uncharacterized protein n=1 Tax=Kwoniella shandongensis TaxID=1734106 RepID=A0A5M6C318_9TREE|nr:uncharacterized protein CI109_002286 [Kwoniella shandongensis]KAA5529393.1 hypothetical protein CI109_002286 [Kwoniella shandongensis]